jgi:hypothetical protein
MVSTAVILVHDPVVDERMRFVAEQATRISLFVTFLLAYLVMIAD